MWSVQALWLLLLPVSWVLLPVLQFLCFCCCFSGSAPAAVVVGARSAAIVFVHNNADSVAAVDGVTGLKIQNGLLLVVELEQKRGLISLACVVSLFGESLVDLKQSCRAS